MTHCVQQGWPTAAQQILIPSTWPQMSGVTIHNAGQPVVADSPEGQQASGWRWVGSGRAGSAILVCSDVSRMFLHRGRYGNQFEGLNQQDSGFGRHGASQSHNAGVTQKTQQGKRSKGRHGDKRVRYDTIYTEAPSQSDLRCSSRPVSAVHPTSVLHATSAGDQSLPIIISDTPSPAVSIITIHSDSEDDRRSPVSW